MLVDWLQKLLILQDRDLRCDSIQRQIEVIPRDIQKEEAAIRALEEQQLARERALKLKEVRRLDLEGEVALAEEQIIKYKTQQMQVKKNEEYTALESEIKRTQDRISELEDAELMLMEELDTDQQELKTARQSTAQEIHTLQAHIDLLRQNLASFSGELDAARAAVVACEGDLEAPILQQYRYVKSQVKRPPVVVAMEENRCQGCHLKVSGEIESLARKGHELVRCDSCGRILYWDR